jgi:hypothetical protein
LGLIALIAVIGVPKLTIVQVKQQQDKKWDEWTLQHGQQRFCQEQKHESKDPDIEEALSQWSNVEKQVSHNEHRGTGGWLSWWKCRFCIILKKGQCCHNCWLLEIHKAARIS